MFSLNFKYLNSRSSRIIVFACIDPMELQREIEKVLRGNGDSATALLDRMMSNSLNSLTSEINQTLFPNGLLKPFLKNCLSLMTTTGAKGGLVSSRHILSLLIC